MSLGLAFVVSGVCYPMAGRSSREGQTGGPPANRANATLALR